ncbi:MAG: folylpolyglutamate synthase/dihydrofolate synthase family protein [Verrucomicrobiota bacterium]
MQYRQAIDWLFATQMFGIKLGLDGPRALLKEYLAFPRHGVRVIHVAGTNGKGSTCAMIDSIARASGRRCGLFTSPHLIDYRERVRVCGEEIPEETCAAMLTALRAICERMETHPTFFEISLALAMRWFRERECDLIVLETGMGGRLDATTAVPADVCVLTPIGLDHTEWLGDTLAEIAAEKAGIFVVGKPAVIAPQDPEAMCVLEKHANESRSPLHVIDEPLLGYSIALPGAHQRWNAALAAAALHHAGIRLSADIVRQGLANVDWPGRFEEIRPHIILDGAHNPQSAQILAKTWRETHGETRPTLIFSAVSSKDIRGILEFLSPLAARIFICPVDSPRVISSAGLAAALPENSPPATCFENFQTAFAAAADPPASAENPILIAGSLFLVGEARAFFTRGNFLPSAQ